MLNLCQWPRKKRWQQRSMNLLREEEVGALEGRGCLLPLREHMLFVGAEVLIWSSRSWALQWCLGGLACLLPLPRVQLNDNLHELSQDKQSDSEYAWNQLQESNSIAFLGCCLTWILPFLVGLELTFAVELSFFLIVISFDLFNSSFCYQLIIICVCLRAKVATAICGWYHFAKGRNLSLPFLLLAGFFFNHKTPFNIKIMMFCSLWLNQLLWWMEVLGWERGSLLKELCQLNLACWKLSSGNNCFDWSAYIHLR